MLAGKYRLRELLARGGMGLVYAARHEITGRALAIKLLRPELAGRADLVRRVSAEARLAVEASHPNVVEVLDAGADELDIPYLVLERLYGHPLDELLAEPLSLVAATQALMPVINALAALHRLGIVHRDIKPSNIFLSLAEDGRVRPKLLDFGIAKALESAGSTLSGVAVGTPAYMAPEQALACAVGPATDVWSMGVVLARCLTGRLPFEGVAIRGFGSLLSGLRPEDLQGVPEPVALVLVDALQLEPGRRPATMEEFRGALLRALQSIAPRQPWPNQLSVDYPRESDLATLLARSRGTTAQGEGQARPGAQARARHILTRTLSKVSQTGSRLQARRSTLRGSIALLLAAAAAWALLARSMPAAESSSASQQPPATVRSIEALPPASGLPNVGVPRKAVALGPVSAAPSPAPDHAAQPPAEAAGVPSHGLRRPLVPALVRTGVRRAQSVRSEATPANADTVGAAEAPPAQSAGVAAPPLALGANRSPIIE